MKQAALSLEYGDVKYTVDSNHLPNVNTVEIFIREASNNIIRMINIDTNEKRREGKK